MEQQKKLSRSEAASVLEQLEAAEALVKEMDRRIHRGGLDAPAEVPWQVCGLAGVVRSRPADVRPLLVTWVLTLRAMLEDSGYTVPL